MSELNYTAGTLFCNHLFLDTLNAKLPKKAIQVRGVEGLSAEGTIFSHFTTSTAGSKATSKPKIDVVDKVVIECKGETFDETISIYYKNVQPVFVQRLYNINPAKLMKPGDDGYDDAIKGKTTETNTWQFQQGKLQSTANKGDTAQLDTERRMADHAQWSLRMMRMKTGKACQWRCTGEGELCGQITCLHNKNP